MSVRNTRRRLIRAERLDTAPGWIGHMTIDEISKRTMGNVTNYGCPACGRIHLSAYEKEEAENEKIVDSPRYQQIVHNSSGN